MWNHTCAQRSGATANTGLSELLRRCKSTVSRTISTFAGGLMKWSHVPLHSVLSPSSRAWKHIRAELVIGKVKILECLGYRGPLFESCMYVPHSRLIRRTRSMAPMLRRRRALGAQSRPIIDVESAYCGCRWSRPRSLRLYPCAYIEQ